MQTPNEVTKLLGKIYDKKVVLFVGNGASIDAGGPKTDIRAMILFKLVRT
jgi:hypothetical protein